jgi:hypothetical protein
MSELVRLDDVRDIPCPCTPGTCEWPNCRVVSLDEIPDLANEGDLT